MNVAPSAVVDRATFQRVALTRSQWTRQGIVPR
jgi:hypothetical protein